jgi:hypothetical protein
MRITKQKTIRRILLAILFALGTHGKSHTVKNQMILDMMDTTMGIGKMNHNKIL